MTSTRLARAALACTALAALAPAAASASTWTVDDDRADCPNAGFTSIQAAVEQAAPWDTVVVCPGLYLEQSTPTSGANTPSQPGSQNGVTITKPLTIRGAGPDKVTIRPAPAAGATLAGTAPFLRDGGGNVVTIARQAGGASDDNENFVDISGVTIDSPTAYAEAGIAFFNTSGRISNSVIGPLLRAADAGELAARPHGWGVLQTNSLQGTEAGVRRQVTVERSVVTGYQSGGILFDDARGADGTPTTAVRSGIVAYGYVVGSRIEGSGPSDLIAQTGVRYHAGARGFVVDSDVLGNSFTPDPRQSVALLLTDAHTTTDPSNPATRGFYAINNRFTGNGYALFNADAANAAVREGAPALATPGTPGSENWWGCGTGPLVGTASSATCQGISGPDTGGAQSVDRGANRTAMQILPAPPGPTPDAPPAGSIAEPLGEAVAGEDSAPVVVASDDFGVKSVSLAVDGVPVATAGHAPYEFSWTPGFAQIGDAVTLTATITDSSDRTTVVTTEVTVAAPAGYAPITVDPLAVDAGSVLVGALATREVTVTNTGENPLELQSLDLAAAGFSRAGTCAPGTTLAIDEACTVALTFAPAAAGSVTGSLGIAYATPGAGPPVAVALTGAGTTPEAPPASPAPPVSAQPPRIAGTAVVGSGLSCLVGSWTGGPTSFTFQWVRDGLPIAGASSDSYAPTRADTASVIACRVTAANAAGTSAPAGTAGVVVRFGASTTSQRRLRQVGPAVASIRRVAHVSRSGRLAAGTISCARATAARCTVRVSGALAIGRTTFRLAFERTVAGDRTANVTFRLSRAARRALALRRAGRLTLQAAVEDDTGTAGSATILLRVTR